MTGPLTFSNRARRAFAAGRRTRLDGRDSLRGAGGRTERGQRAVAPMPSTAIVWSQEFAISCMALFVQRGVPALHRESQSLASGGKRAMSAPMNTPATDPIRCALAPPVPARPHCWSWICSTVSSTWRFAGSPKGARSSRHPAPDRGLSPERCPVIFTQFVYSPAVPCLRGSVSDRTSPGGARQPTGFGRPSSNCLIGRMRPGAESADIVDDLAPLSGELVVAGTLTTNSTARCWTWRCVPAARPPHDHGVTTMSV